MSRTNFPRPLGIVPLKIAPMYLGGPDTTNWCSLPGHVQISSSATRECSHRKCAGLSRGEGFPKQLHSDRIRANSTSVAEHFFDQKCADVSTGCGCLKQLRFARTCTSSLCAARPCLRRNAPIYQVGKDFPNNYNFVKISANSPRAARHRFDQQCTIASRS